MKVRTYKTFSRLSDPDLSRLTGKVILGLTNNLAYPEPPADPEALALLKKDFDEALIAANKGGSLATAKKNVARATLTDGLGKDASYVDIRCEGDLATLLSSGFEAVSTNRSQSMLEAPLITSVESPQTGKLQAKVKGGPNTKSFVGHIRRQTDTEFGPAISFKNSRAIIFDGLVSGVTYVLEVMGIGGTTGKSDWSSPGTGMAK